MGKLLATIMLLALCVQVHAKTYAQEKINLQLKKATIKILLDEVERQTAYRFVYHTGTLPTGKKIDITVRNADLEEVLEKAFDGLSLKYTVKEDNLVVIFSSENTCSK